MLHVNLPDARRSPVPSHGTWCLCPCPPVLRVHGGGLGGGQAVGGGIKQLHALHEGAKLRATGEMQ